MKVAIVGFGPRGLSALENLIELAISNDILDSLDVILFNAEGALGSGKAWGLSQPDSNLINISDHALKNLEGRPKLMHTNFMIADFPSYKNWCLENMKEVDADFDMDKDIYPPRSQMGRYLNERAISIVEPLTNVKLLKVIQDQVISVRWNGYEFDIITKENIEIKCDECLITIGHQPIEDTEEQRLNKTHATKSDGMYIHKPYEAAIEERDLSNSKVSIIGLGLSMIDITRMLTTCQGGKFIKNDSDYFLTYEYSKDNPMKIVPYSLDGLPCVPKPYGRKVDSLFEPTRKQQDKFQSSIEGALKESQKVENFNFLLDAFAQIAADIYIALENRFQPQITDKENLQQRIIEWLKDDNNDHDIFLSTSLPPKEYMIATVHMAMGTQPISLDFCIGQVWRHLQPAMYRQFAYAEIPDNVMEELIDVDENSKRYSYGPPVESILQLIALNEAGFLDLSFSNDPEITRTKRGWALKKNDQIFEANVLINSVMDGPDLSKMNAAIMKDLKAQNLPQPVAESLGVKTHSDGTVMNTKDGSIPLSFIGRNTKGSILGADAILECFSPEIKNWAEGVLKRY